MREYRETYASWLMLQAFRLKERDASKSYGDLHKTLGEAKSVVPTTPSDAATESGWWLANVKPAGASVVPEVLRAFPNVAQGRNAQTQRESDAFTEFDGYVPEAGKVLDPCAASYGVSATALEEAATCGFKHFLKRGLRLDVIDDGERDGDVWLEPMVRGGELHDLYARSLRRCRDEKRRADRKRDLPWLLDIARKRLEELRIEMPPPSDEVYERETTDFLADLELFLEAEFDRPVDRTPVGLEVAFGRSYGEHDDDGEPLAQSEPVEIDLGGGLKFRLTGRIDRIDQIGPSSFEVIDYKTGGYWADDWATGVFAGGRRLQHALYGLAATKLLTPALQETDRLRGRLLLLEHEGRTGAARDRDARPPLPPHACSRTCAARSHPAHSRTPTMTTIARYCDFKRACGMPREVEQVVAKLEDDKA